MPPSSHSRVPRSQGPLISLPTSTLSAGARVSLFPCACVLVHDSFLHGARRIASTASPCGADAEAGRAEIRRRRAGEPLARVLLRHAALGTTMDLLGRAHAPTSPCRHHARTSSPVAWNRGRRNHRRPPHAEDRIGFAPYAPVRLSLNSSLCLSRCDCIRWLVSWAVGRSLGPRRRAAPSWDACATQRLWPEVDDGLGPLGNRSTVRIAPVYRIGQIKCRPPIDERAARI